MRFTAFPLVLFSLFSATALAQSFTVEEARVRAVPPGSTTTAAFLVLTNPGETDLALVGGASPLAGRQGLSAAAGRSPREPLQYRDRLFIDFGLSLCIAPSVAPTTRA